MKTNMASKDLKIPTSISGKAKISSDAKLLLGFLLGGVKYAEPETFDVGEIAAGTGIQDEQISEALLELLGEGFIARGGEKAFLDMSYCRVSLDLVVTPGGSGVTKDGQQLLQVDDQKKSTLEDGGEETKDVDGTPHLFRVTPELDVEFDATGRWCLNAWRLDDLGEQIAHVIQGADFATKTEAIEYAYAYAGNGVYVESGVLGWMLSLPDDQQPHELSSGRMTPVTVYVSFGAMVLAIEDLEFRCPYAEGIEENAAKRGEYMAWLDKAEETNEIEWHGRLYKGCWPSFKWYKDYVDPRPAMPEEVEESENASTVDESEEANPPESPNGIVMEDPTPEPPVEEMKAPRKGRTKKVDPAPTEQPAEPEF